MLSFSPSYEVENLHMSREMPVLQEVAEVEDRLNYFGVTIEELRDVVRVAVSARHEALPVHPLGAAGQLAYIHGTGALRTLFMSKGWEKKSTDNIEAVFNSDLGVKIIYQNADRAGDPVFAPLSASPKGPGSAKVVENGQGELFETIKKAEQIEQTAAVYYLFVEGHSGNVRAELSRPISIEAEQFHGFHERIMIVQSGEWQGIDLTPDESPLPDFEIEISRKL